MTKINKTKICLILSLSLCFISMIGSYIVQTNFTKVEVKKLQIETKLGRELSLLLFVPENASIVNKAPAIVTSHGWYNNKEMQDLNFVEFSRRGYVVAAIDMYGHGNSSPLPSSETSLQGTGMYDAVELLASLPYVDKDNIGITGHSNGARAANFSVAIDNKNYNPLIKSVLLIANDATYKNEEKEYANMYDTRDVGIIACLYDEFFFRTYHADGTISAPRDYIDSDNAQSFLHFGKDPQNNELEKRLASNFYIETIRMADHRIGMDEPEIYYSPILADIDATRIIYTPKQIHPWNHFSKQVSAMTIDFFERTLKSPNPIPSDNQIWQVKTAFNALGLLGFALFVLSFTKILLKTNFFSPLRAFGPVEALPTNLKGLAWHNISLILGILFSAISYLYLFVALYTMNSSEPLQSTTIFTYLLHQTPPLFIGLWSVLNALFTMLLFYLGNKINKEQTFSYKDRGISININELVKTLLLSFLVVFASFSIVFLADFLFNTDFRIWVLAIKAFNPDKFIYIILFFPFFLFFYIINSISINCYNYIKGLPAFLNLIILAIINASSSLLLIIGQYFVFFNDGRAAFETMFGSVFFNIIGIWLFPIFVFLFLFPFFARAIFKETRNPYLPAIIYSLIVTILACTNTLTELPY